MTDKTTSICGLSTDHKTCAVLIGDPDQIAKDPKGRKLTNSLKSRVGIIIIYNGCSITDFQRCLEDEIGPRELKISWVCFLDEHGGPANKNEWDALRRELPKAQIVGCGIKAALDVFRAEATQPVPSLINIPPAVTATVMTAQG